MPSFDEINECIAEGSVEIESWVSRQRKKVEVPLYTSVDVRISKHKIAPVDTNIFPAGFNNLSADCRLHASELFKNYFALKYPEIEKILIIPELHTRNTYYWENIHVLKSILTTVGFEVEVGLISDDLRSDSVELKTSSGGVVTARSLRRSGSYVHTSNFRPDLLLINNDFSDKCPEIFREIVQPVEPPVELGWHSRRKDIHFEFYNKLAYEVARMVDIDPWVFTLETIAVRGVDFDSPRDREWVADVVDEVLESLREQYSSRGIDEEPFVIIKSNYGTYGMAVISVVGGDDVRRLNAGGRKRMRVAKGGMIVRDVVVQEGVHTSLKLGSGGVTEPVAYLVEADVAGAFLRFNKGKGEMDNLNARGMEFTPIDCIHSTEGREYFPVSAQLISRTASLACGYEIERMLSEWDFKKKVS